VLEVVEVALKHVGVHIPVLRFPLRKQKAESYKDSEYVVPELVELVSGHLVLHEPILVLEEKTCFLPR
jgi:hypothetical protein